MSEELHMIEKEPFEKRIIQDISKEKQLEIIEDIIRWAKHCGHYHVTEGLERYLKLVVE